MNIITLILLIFAIATGVYIGNDRSLYKRIASFVGKSLFKVLKFLFTVLIGAGIVYLASSMLNQIGGWLGQLNADLGGRLYYYMVFAVILIYQATTDFRNIKKERSGVGSYLSSSIKGALLFVGIILSVVAILVGSAFVSFDLTYFLIGVIVVGSMLVVLFKAFKRPQKKADD